MESCLISHGGENLLGFLSHGRKLGVPLELLRGPQLPARVASGKSSLRSIYEGPLGIPLQSVQGHRASSQVEAEKNSNEAFSLLLCSCDIFSF